MNDKLNFYKVEFENGYLINLGATTKKWAVTVARRIFIKAGLATKQLRAIKVEFIGEIPEEWR